MNLQVKTQPQCIITIEKGIVLNKGIPKGFVITDRNIYSKYGFLIKDKFFIIEPSEKSKSLGNYVKILENLGEEDIIIALGGGVVGDLAGFVASTYKRGIQLIQIPTTLLAMVDSSIGGKNGVNLNEKKNYVGTIYQPSKVLIDPLFLQTLHEEEIKNGLAEVIKYNYLFNSPDLNEIFKNPNINECDIERIIFDCCKNKTNVIEKDLFDKSFRHALNFGHTIGHGIELIVGISHGKAISIGMVKEAELGVRLGIISKEDVFRLKETLNKVGLPTELPNNLDIQKMLQTISQDKKGKFVFALTKDNYSIKVDERLIREVLEGK